MHMTLVSLNDRIDCRCHDVHFISIIIHLRRFLDGELNQISVESASVTSAMKEVPREEVHRNNNELFNSAQADRTSRVWL